MPLDLHVWGPGFGLPSIDAECLATILYLSHTVPKSEYRLIASNDPAVSPYQTLPALQHDGRWISGYSSITTYLQQRGLAVVLNGTEGNGLILDTDLTSSQRADALAYTSFLRGRGAALLSLSLYVSTSSWTELTRPTYSTLLPFPLTWTTPLAIRSAAIQRVEHLGLGSLAADVDDLAPSEAEDSHVQGGNKDKTTGTAYGNVPASFTRYIKKTHLVTSALKPEQTASFRLYELAEDFYAAIDHLKKGKKFLLSDEAEKEKPSTLDFLTVAYLNLMLVETPHPWLKQVLDGKFPHLRQYADSLRVAKAGLAMEELPWTELAPGRVERVTNVCGRFLEGVVLNTPGVGEVWTNWGRGGSAAARSDTLFGIGGALVGLAAVGVAVLYRSLPPFGARTHRFEPPEEEKQGLHKYGEIGSILASLPVWEEKQVATGKPLQPHREIATQAVGGVDVTVEVENRSDV